MSKKVSSRFVTKIAKTFLSEFRFSYHRQPSHKLSALIFQRFMIYCDPNSDQGHYNYQKCIEDHKFPHIPMLCFFSNQYTPQLEFVIPEFVIQSTLPRYDAWLWQPSVVLTLPKFIIQLRKELYYGGWPKNAKGQQLIPKRTGRIGTPYYPEQDTGWAVERPGYVERIRRTQE